MNLAAARTLLFVPGNRPERFAKALASDADAVVLDLEDSVPAGEKAAARDAIAAQWPAMSGPVVIRVNAGEADLPWLRCLADVGAVMLPKAESASQVARVAQAAPGALIIPLIESAAGYAALPEIAAAPGVLRLAVGNIDFSADTGIRCSDDERELAPLRFAVAIQTRLCGLAPAIDGVTTAFDDVPRLRADTLRALSFGFGGKLCIHPRQVAVIHEAMRPTAEELQWAQRVLDADAAANGAAVQLDGRMVDVPVVLQARRTLARA